VAQELHNGNSGASVSPTHREKRVRWPAQEKMEVRRRGVLTGEDGGDDFVWLDGAWR
jgi:hypothetical protein